MKLLLFTVFVIAIYLILDINVEYLKEENIIVIYYTWRRKRYEYKIKL